MYYFFITLLHVIGLVIWFGSALIVLFLSKAEQSRILWIIEKTQLPPAFFVPLTGCLLLIERTYFFSEIWMLIKIFLSIIAAGLVMISRKKINVMNNNEQNPSRHILKYQSFMLLILTLVLLVVFGHG